MAHTLNTNNIDSSVASLEIAIAGALVALIIIGYAFSHGALDNNDASQLPFDAAQAFSREPK